MRVVFMGTPRFAVPSLLALSVNHDVVAVYTRPDSASGRGRRLIPSPVKQAAEELGVPVVEPGTLREPAAPRALADLRPDIIVVAAYGLILPKEVLEIPPMGCINIHASLLPRWRGAAPIQRAILAGDTVTGVSIMRMEEGLDTGPYCVTRTTEVADKTTTSLTDELAHLGAEALLEALALIALQRCEWTEQDDNAATYAPKIAKDDVALEPALSTSEALRRVRASSPQAPARFRTHGRTITVLSATLADRSIPQGSIECTKDDLFIGVANGTLRIGTIKPEGKAEMAGCDWARGSLQSGSATWDGTR